MTDKISDKKIATGVAASSSALFSSGDERMALLIKEIQFLQIEKLSLQNKVIVGIMEEAEAAEMRDVMTKREFSLKKKLVDEVHITNTGEPRAISYHKPTKGYPDGYKYTRIGKEKVKARSMELLYDKLYEYYYGSNSQTIEAVFNKAMEEKCRTENLKEQTAERYKNDFKKLITDNLKKKKVTSITDLDIKAYTQDLVNNREKNMTEKKFLAYKGVLNIIFRYALTHGIIEINPVPALNNKAYLKSCDTSKATPEEKIFSEEEVKQLIAEVRRRMNYKRWSDYYPLGFMLIFASLTGCRIGELCAIMWKDIDLDELIIHIHAQQLVEKVNGHIRYRYDPHTKDEKGQTQEGRFFPIYQELEELLLEIKEKQERYKVKSEYVFCLRNGSWIKIHDYTKFLRRICNKVGLNVTNNHAFRMGLNSNVLIPAGFTVVERAALLGHSAETNFRHYTYTQKEYLTKAQNKLNSFKHPGTDPGSEPQDTE